MIEDRSLTVLTDHKPITFVFTQNLEKCSPRQLLGFYWTIYNGQQAHIRDKQHRGRRTL